MGGASKLLSLLSSSPLPLLRLRPSTAAFSILLSSPSRRRGRHLLVSSPPHLRTLSSLPRAAFHDAPTSSSPSPLLPPPPATAAAEWSRFVDRLAAAGYASRAPCAADELAGVEGWPGEAAAAVTACLGFARERPELLRSLPKRDVEVVVENVAPSLFKDGESSARRLQVYLGGDESNVYQPEQAETVDIMRYLLSYAYNTSDSYSKSKEVADSAVRSLLAELVSVSGLIQTSSFVESTPKQTLLSQHEHFTRNSGQNIEMKRGDWICPRCSFMNFARNSRCLECNEERPKKMLAGGEWECPQCEFYNYGRNMSCLRCDCKRPGIIPLNPTSPGSGVGYNRDASVAQMFNGTNIDKSEIERKLALNDEKAERWLSKVSQLDDSADLSSLAADEDFPEIMPMRKGVNKFVVSTRKTPLERRLANAQSNINNASSNTSSDSKVSQTLDRILGRSKSTSGTTNKPGGTGGVNTGTQKKLADQLGDIDSVPFVPLPADMFAKPQNTTNNTQIYKDDQMPRGDNSTTASVPSADRKGAEEASDTAEKWSKKVAELDYVTDLSSAIPDEDFPEIMPMRKGENRFVISKKKDRSLTSPQYKRRIALEQANNSNFVPFVPFPPGYFANKDKPVESDPAAGPVSQGSQPAEKVPEPNASAHSLGTNPYPSQVMNSQSNSNLNTGNWNTNYSQQNLNESKGGYAYGQSGNSAQSTLNGVGGQSHPNTGAWNPSYSQGSFNKSTGSSAYHGNNNYSAQRPNASGYNNSNNAWNSNTNNGQNGSSTSDGSPNSTGASGTPNQPRSYSNSGENWNRGNAGQSLEGSAVKEPDPLDMSEEAKAERWFRRAAQIKDISELANIPDEDFPEIMPMRKGVNRFVVSKRKTPLERRLTSPQYRRNLPIVSSEPDKDAS